MDRYLFKPVEDELQRKQIAELPQREYLCGNKNHYVLTTIKDDAVFCELCQKIYTYADCGPPISIKEEKQYADNLQNQLLPAV